MTNLYRLEEHSITGQFIVRKFEVIGEMPMHYDVQPRSIANKRAEHVTRRIAKDAAYFLSPDEAIQNYLQKQKRRIAMADQEIDVAQALIDRVERDLEFDYEENRE